MYGLCGNYDGSKTHDLSRPGNPTDSLLQEQKNNAVEFSCEADVPEQPDWNNLGCAVRLVLSISIRIVLIRKRNKYCVPPACKIKKFNQIYFRYKMLR